MRALLGLLVLGALFIMAASWQNRMTSRLREDRSQRYNVASDSVAGQEGWSRLILGRPSGAEPLPLPDPLPEDQQLAYGAGGGAPGELDPGDQSQGGIPPIAPSASGPRYRPDDRHVVQKDEVLSTICQNHYDVRPLHLLVDRVAIYNDLKTANDIRIGTELRLPDPAVLFPDR